ncbi:MAG TPA: hypothetical protein VGG64_23150 [Pirellulales bacterium]|jgi:hypothetical protein
MSLIRLRWRLLLASIVVVSVTTGLSLGSDDHPNASGQQPQKIAEDGAIETPHYVTETLRGRLVWLAEALKRRFGVETDADAAEAAIAIEASDGKLVPLVKDFHSRGFWLDPRLRADEVELVVRRYEQSPAVQLVRWYAIRKGRKYEVDYWCDICAIPMYELKTCDCCQGEIRLRERLVEADVP